MTLPQTPPTFRPIKVIDIELSQPLPTFTGLERYEKLQALIRLQGTPIGYLTMPLPHGCCSSTDLGKAILEQYSWVILRQLTARGIPHLSETGTLSLEDLLRLSEPEEDSSVLPLVTVAVCTRDRTPDLKICLDSLLQLRYPHLDILVVDNAPSNDETAQLIQQHYPHVRYVREDKPGVGWARTRAIVEAQGEIIAYADDDVIVDPLWIRELVRAYQEVPGAMAVAGLVPPYELETEAQILFEQRGGFSRGFDRKIYQVPGGGKLPWYLVGTGQFGTGANMSFRRSLFTEIKGFNPALKAGEDLDLFFRVIKAGHAFVYEPRAIVRHRHRREYEKLRKQLVGYGMGIYAYHTCGFLNYPEERWSFLLVGLWWLWYGNLRRLWISWKYPNRFPKDLIWAEFIGCFQGIQRYFTELKDVMALSEEPTDAPSHAGLLPSLERVEALPPLTPEQQMAIAVRTLELSKPLPAIANLENYLKTQVFLTWNRHPIGSIEVANGQKTVQPDAIGTKVFDSLGLKALNPDSPFSKDVTWAYATSQLLNLWDLNSATGSTQQPLSAESSVSIVVATYDRPKELRRCLLSLAEQQTKRRIEIIVVDNHPASNLTPPVVAEFPDVILVKEPRQGLAYARNAGIVTSTGDIIVMTDDDVTAPPQWLESLVQPFARPEVMVVTGNVLPAELETESQRLFETYGGLGRGFQSFEVTGDWFEQFPRKPAPTWTLGATANAAFRAHIFEHPAIGLMNEALGPGMPSGVGEDTYLFYKVLKAGYTLVYKPEAYVQHWHRRDMAALRRQIYNYSKGHVAYHLTTLFSDRDWRGLVQILAGLPMAHLTRSYYRLRGWSEYPISLILVEILGNLAAPWSLWVSHLRVKRLGYSQPYKNPHKQTALEPQVTTI